MHQNPEVSSEDKQLAEELLEPARKDGVELIGPDGRNEANSRNGTELRIW